MDLPSLKHLKTYLFHQYFYLPLQHHIFPNVELFIYACILVADTCLFACFSFRSNLLYSALELWDHARYNYYYSLY